MKPLSLSLIVITTLLFLGCSKSLQVDKSPDIISVKEESPDTFALKEKCNKYLTNGQKQTDQLSKVMYYDKYSYNLVGVFYSRTKDTCVTVIHESWSNGFTYKDVLTGEEINSAGYLARDRVEKELGLVH